MKFGLYVVTRFHNQAWPLRSSQFENLVKILKILEVLSKIAKKS